MTFAYARVVGKDHSPPRSYINTFDAIFGKARLGPLMGPPHLKLLGDGPEVKVT